MEEDIIEFIYNRINNNYEKIIKDKIWKNKNEEMLKILEK